MVAPTVSVLEAVGAAEAVGGPEAAGGADAGGSTCGAVGRPGNDPTGITGATGEASVTGSG